MEQTTELKPVLDEDIQTNAKIRVIGIGGGGSNAVNGMIHDKEDQVDYWVMNTDSQALANSPCPNKIVLGRNVTRGLGAGGNPDQGRIAAEDSLEDIRLVVQGSDMVFLACGEGGGTGTGAAPVVAKAAKDEGALVLAIVTRPFTFEGKKRSLNALEGINTLRQNVDALIVVSNDKMMFNNGKMSFKEAFAASDKILASSVKTVTDLILRHGLINLDFADVKATLTGKGLALIGIGYGQGKDKAIISATNAINSPLLESSIQGSRSMIINVTIGNDTSLDDVQHTINEITQTASGSDDNNVNIIFGVQIDDSYVDKMKVAIIATDFDKKMDFSTAPKPVATRNPTQPQRAEEKPQTPVQKEIQAKQDRSILPDYLRQFMKGATEEADSIQADIPQAAPTEPVEDVSSSKGSDESVQDEAASAAEKQDEEMAALTPDSALFR